MHWFYLDGQFVERGDAKIPVEQTGIARSYGVFDFFRTVHSQPRFLEDYLARFAKSQTFLGLSRQVEEAEVMEAITELQQRNGFDHSSFKLILLGDGPDGADVYDPLFMVLNFPLSTQRPESVKLISHEYVRDFPEIKSLNYFTSFSLTRKKAAAGASEVLFHKDGVVSEASRCNVFAIRDGELWTPKDNILRGITRMHVMRSAKQLLPVKEGDMSLEDLVAADEVFITSTTKDIMPVSHIDEHVIADGRPGPWSLRLQKVFAEYYQDGVKAV